MNVSIDKRGDYAEIVEGVIKNGQPRDIGNIGHKTHNEVEKRRIIRHGQLKRWTTSIMLLLVGQ